MATHVTKVKRSGEGVVGTCSCRLRQMKPVPTKQLAQDWIVAHLQQVARAQAGLRQHLSPAKYLEYLTECAEDSQRSEGEREQWKALAEEYATRVKGKKLSFDTGVETEPLFDL